MKKQARMWVHPSFKKKIKLEATQNDLPIIEYTKLKAEEQNINEFKAKKIKPKHIFKW